MGMQANEGDSGHYCDACGLSQDSAAWHYRHSPNGTREFICETAYEALSPMERARWLSCIGG